MVGQYPKLPSTRKFLFLFRSVPFRSVPFRSVPFLVLYTVCWFLVYSLVIMVRLSSLSLFWFLSEYLQIFLGIPETGILPDTSVI
jgi:hypothetical protein